ncbi:hypothetical protein Q7P37_006763 [Cladosporium fusiforme]
MSSDRNNQGRPPPPLKPTLASARNPRTPLTPRLAANGTPSTAAKRTPTVRPEAPTTVPRGARPPQVRVADTSARDGDRNTNVTQRSSARTSRTESPSNGQTSGVSPNSLRVRPTSGGIPERAASAVGLGIGVGSQNRPKVGQARSILSDNGSSRVHSPLVRSPGHSESGHSSVDNVDSRFFHASDAVKQELAPKRPELPKRQSVFFHADGSTEGRPLASKAPSLAAPSSEKKSSDSWAYLESGSNRMTSPPPLLSPPLSSVSMSSSSPFFAPLPPAGEPRPASPSKENIHLSYRRGASQIFGLRPSPIPSPRVSVEQPNYYDRRESLEQKPTQPSHRKSTSLSSIDSHHSINSRRRSATTLDPSANATSPLSQESTPLCIANMGKPPEDMPSIETSLESTEENGGLSPSDGTFNPTKSVSELAADARRERKVLDLEISNSSLLAINASLEREVRRQKAELKRFRRLSRAGKFGFDPHERTARLSECLSTLGEEDEDKDEDNSELAFARFADGDDDLSDDDDSESLTSGGEPLSPGAREDKDQARLAKDEQKVRADIEKHKELLVQSQMMNQSLKRCMYATEEMINEGKKALQYSVRVSDVKLGGRILTDNDDDDDNQDDSMPDIEVEDDTSQGADLGADHAKGFLDVWSNLGGGGFGGSEGGDRDSGIEVDKPLNTSAPGVLRLAAGRPPESELWQRRRYQN